MNIQVLVAAMHQQDGSLIEKMNIQTDAIVGNQCDRCSDEVYDFDGFTATYYNRPERGVGLNRNTALLHAADDSILTFADEDMTFVDGYAEQINKAFSDLPKADAVIFNITTVGTDVGRRENTSAKRVRFYNALNYGAARLSVKSTSIKRENIMFHTCFGGGTRYNAGEDSLFITDMLRHKLRIYVYPVCIANVDQTASTWFNGYDEKYLHDKGTFFAAASKKWAKLLCLQDLIRHKEIYSSTGLGFSGAYRLMKKGIKDFTTLTAYGK